MNINTSIQAFKPWSRWYRKGEYVKWRRYSIREPWDSPPLKGKTVEGQPEHIVS